MRDRLLKSVFLFLLSGVLTLGGSHLVAHAQSQSAAEQMLDHLYKKASATDPVMSAKALQSAINTAVLRGESEVSLTGNVYLTESIRIQGLTRPFTLNGQGYTVMFAFPGRENERHILITQPEGLNLTFTLTNIRLQGPGYGNIGGGISVGSGVDIKLEQCLLIGNRAKEGGGVYNYNNAIHLKNCAVINNTAQTGGGLYSYYGQIIIEGEHSVLSGNTATDPDTGGGAAYGHRGGLIAESGVSFTGNHAAGIGGAIYQPGGLISLNGAYLSANTAASGGAIAAGEDIGSISIQNSLLSENKATGRQNSGYGGALYRKSGGTVDIQSSSLNSNTAMFGGAIFTGSGEGDSMWISYSVMKNNSAEYDGGAVYTSDRISTVYPEPVYITMSRLDYNSAGRDGGAICAPNRAAVRLSGVGFSGNTAVTSCVWDVSKPDPLYTADAATYIYNIRAVTPSGRNIGGKTEQLPNVYNNHDINFPSRAGVIFRPWGGRWEDNLNLTIRRRDPFVGEQTDPPAPPVYGDYLFGGWRVATAGHPNEGQLWSFGEPVLRPTALDAVWLTPDESAKLILKPMGGIWGDGGSRNITLDIKKNSPGYQPYTLSREGYRFLGWANQATNRRWRIGIDAVTESGIVLVARWELIS